jgi:hypothetical protein
VLSPGLQSVIMSTLDTAANASAVTSTAFGVARLNRASNPTNTSGQIR